MVENQSENNNIEVFKQEYKIYVCSDNLERLNIEINVKNEIFEHLNAYL